MRSREAAVYLELRTEERGYLPEGPRLMTVAGFKVLVWVNIQNSASAKSGTIFAHQIEGGRDDFSMPCPGRPGFIHPLKGGDRALVGVEKELRVCNLAKGEWSEPLARIPDDNPRTIINDAEIVPGGKAVVFGTKDTLFKEQIANLYLYTVDDNRVSLLADKQLCSNGKVFYTDERGLILFDIDTPTRKVVRYRLDVAARTVTPDGVALDLANQIGFPDGMCDCGDGTVIIAFYNPEFAKAGKAIRFNLSTGETIEEWLTPGSPRVTCPLADGTQLILTTAIEGMPAEMLAKCPNAGCLFKADVKLASCPVAEAVRL
ncbi:MAG TPA: SMP-30/gluconolactonase/LRE family protein [Gemmata sp.]|nr:SMP-30/gluconolactonase/LRE family protein [Gemmata sp.]